MGGLVIYFFPPSHLLDDYDTKIVLVSKKKSLLSKLSK